MRDSRLFDSVVGYASDSDDAVRSAGRLDETEDPWRLHEIESERDQPDPRIGQTLGSIRLESQVGQGGMGTVFEGWDEKLRRKVAVKAVSRHYRSNVEARERFLREARLLSKLQHPNICQIHDHVEGPDGDYLILELVEGRSLRSILEAGETFSLGDGLRIARQLSAALMAAHDRGVAHRDLKPGNVMITPDGTAKVLDFGLGLSVERAVEKGSAKAGLEWTESGSIKPAEIRAPKNLDEDDVTLVGGRRDTRHSHDRTSTGSIEGTLAYMSPEQARSEPAGTASDIYSLGLVLQEIFTGRGAYPADLPVTNQLVRAGQGDTLPVEGIDSDLARLIQRMKSVAPGSRPSAPDVAERLGWIADKPKRRLRTLALGAFVAMLVVFSAVMAYQRSRIAEEAARANREAESARQVTEYLKSVFEVADPWNAETADVSARELLLRGTERIRTELRDQPVIRARLLSTMGEVTRRLGLYEEARSLLEESLRLQRELSVSPRDVSATVASLAHLAADVGNFDLSVEGYQEAIEIQREHVGTDNLDLALYILNLGCAEHSRGNSDTARELYMRSLSMLNDVAGPNSLETSKVFSQLAQMTSQQGRHEEAGEYHRRALEIREALLPPHHPDLGTSYYNLAVHYQRQGKHREALPLFLRDLEISQASLGTVHPNVAYGHRYLSSNLLQLGRFEEAAEHARTALEIHQQIYQDDHHQIPISFEMLGRTYRDQGKTQEALELFEEAARRDRELHGDQDTGLAWDLLNAGSAYYDLRNYLQAAERQREALEIWIGQHGSDHAETAEARVALAKTLLAAGRLEESERQSNLAIPAIEKKLVETPSDFLARQLLASGLAVLARAKNAQGESGEAEALLERAISILEQLRQETEVVSVTHDLVEALVAAGRVEEAEPMARKLLEQGYGRQDLVDLGRGQGWLD